MTTSQRTCIAAGHICLDIIPDLLGQKGFLSAIKPGHLLAVGAPSMSPGGSVSNTGLALQKVGIHTRLMGKIGEDPFGRELHALLSAIDPHLTSQMRAVPGEHTSYSFIISPPDSDRVFLHSSGANNTFGAADIDYDQVAEADLFHFGYPTLMATLLASDGRELSELLRRAKATGVTTSLDTSMFDRSGPAGSVNWPALLARTLPYVDVFLPSLDEVLLMLDPQRDPQRFSVDQVRDLAADLLDFGARIVVLKQGQRGIYVRTGSMAAPGELGRAYAGAAPDWARRELWAPAFVAHVVGTTGAGDCAVAGFLASIMRKEALEQALLAAAAVGACNVEAADPYTGLRSWRETMARVAAGWPQHQLDLPGWRYDQAARLWIGPADRQHGRLQQS